MFDHRFVLKHVLVCLLLGSLFVVAPGAAQDTGSPSDGVVLKLAHGGVFLPGGTALVVLADQSGLEPGSSLQPRFLAPDTYPLQTASVMRHDTLDARGVTRTRYPTTKTASARYFIYARTPNETIYWSYSAQKDSIKYDTIDRGVMAVAPISDAEARAQVIQTFFEGSASATPALVESETVAPPATTPQDAMGSKIMSPPRERAGILLPYGGFFLLLASTLACLGGLLFLTLHYRTRLIMKTEPDAALTPFNAADWHPDHRSEHEQELAEIKTNYERLQKTYNVLLDHHKTLIREVQPPPQGAERPPQETPTQRFPQDPPKVSP